MAMERNGTPVGTAVETHKLVCATGDTNHNKFWNAILYTSDDVEIEFGRIGVTSTKGVHRGAGKHFMLKKMGEKEKGKVNKKTGQREPYTEIQTMEGTGVTSGSSVKSVAKSELASLATKQIEHSSPATAKLIKWLADINRHNIHKATGGQVSWDASKGLFQTPMGIVPPSSITTARSLLIDIADHVANIDNPKHKASRRKWQDSSFVQNVQDYVTYIPHNMGMKWSPEKLVPNIAAVQRENGILDALDASYVSATSVQVKGKKKTKTKVEPKLFETKLIMVEDGKVIDRIRRKYKDSSNRSHYQVRDLKVKIVWTVEVGPMARDFEDTGKKVGNVKELWHGTQASNLLSILKVGLVIPPSSSSHCTGRMFGDGVYFSDQSTKALNYATSFWGGRDVGRYFMFLANVAMGKEYIPSGYNTRTRLPAGYHSTFAKAGRSGVQNNEMIVYKTNQASLIYLVEFGR